MEKREFIYVNRGIRFLFAYGLAIIFVVVSVKILDHMILNSTLFWGIQSIFLLFILLVWPIISERIFSSQRKGFYWKERGITHIELEQRVIALDDVKEICVCKPSPLNHYSTLLLIRNADRKILLHSPMAIKHTSFDDTPFYSLFEHLIAENQQLIPESGINEKTGFLYKAR